MKRKLLRVLKGLTITTLLLVTIVFAIYTMAWFALTKRSEAYLNTVWNDKSFVITGEKPTFTGYPNPPEAHFSGTIEHIKSGFNAEAPLLNYSGFPVARQLQYLEAPNGLRISAPFIEQNLNFEYASIQIRMPRHFPNTTKKTDITEWQKSDDKLTIPAIVLKSGKINILASGTIFLDENLQITADLDARVTGMDELLDDLEQTQGKKSVAFARSFLNMLAAIDEKTGEKYFQTTLKIQNRAIYFGPMRVTGLPEIKWE